MIANNKVLAIITARGGSKSIPLKNLYKLNKKGGQTGAIKLGMSKNKSQYSIFMDSDLQDDPIYLPKFVKKINSKLDLVVGKRISRNPPFIIVIATKVFDQIMELFFKKK